MPAKLTLTIVLESWQKDVIEKATEQSGLSASAVVRRFIRYGIQNNPDMLRDDLNRQKAELDAKLKAIGPGSIAPDNIPEFIIETSSKAGTSDKRGPIEVLPEDVIENWVGDVHKQTGTGRIARQHVRDVLKVYPDLIRCVPEDKRQYIQGGE